MMRHSYSRDRSNLFHRQPLGEVLVEAGLILPSQVELALSEQRTNSQFMLGEILALRGWLRKETADFFVCDWQKIVRQRSRQPIGYYLKQAALLSEAQIVTILQEQQKTGARFGTVAVFQGLLNIQTLNYFLTSLSPQELKHSLLDDGKLSISSSQAKPILTKLDEDSFFSDDFEVGSFDYIEDFENEDDSIIWIG